MPPSQIVASAGLEPRSHVYDPGDDRGLLGMRPAWVPERVRYDSKSFDLTDLVLDPDTKPAQPLIILLFHFGQFAAFGLLVR